MSTLINSSDLQPYPVGTRLEYYLKRKMYEGLQKYQNRSWVELIGIGLGAASALISIVTRIIQVFDTFSYGIINLFHGYIDKDFDSLLGARLLLIQLPVNLLHLTFTPIEAILDVIGTTFIMLLDHQDYLQDRIQKYSKDPIIFV